VGTIYDLLSELGVKMIVANPKAVRAIAEAKIKTDKIDA
jgi:transposase